MIPCNSFYQNLIAAGVDFYAGVPDSLLKDICAYINDEVPSDRHVIAANEGAAVALATGHHLATGNLGLVYLQNSGLGNMVNPLTSLTDPEVYSIPMLLLIGWRGEPGVHDEPQHRKQGRITLETLQALEIPHAILPTDSVGVAACVADAARRARQSGAPFALVVRKGTFEIYQPRKLVANNYEMTREEALIQVLESLDESAVVVSTTGMASREVFEHRERTAAGHGRDFLTVGCMGHSSQIAMGIARAKGDRLVYCLDGDGAWVMHMGSVAIVGVQQPQNFRHVVINNGAHDSVGGQPTVGFHIDIPAIARACGYQFAKRVASQEALRLALRELREARGPALLEICVRRGARADLGRPTQTPARNKVEFMERLSIR